MQTWFYWSIAALSPAAAVLVLGIRALRGGIEQRAGFRDLTQAIEWLAPGSAIVAGHVLETRTEVGRVAIAGLSAGSYLLAALVLTAVTIALQERLPFAEATGWRARLQYAFYSISGPLAFGGYLLLTAALAQGPVFVLTIRLYVILYLIAYYGEAVGARVAKGLGRWERLGPCELYSNILRIARRQSVDVEEVRVMCGNGGYRWAGAVAYHENAIGLGESMVQQLSREEVDAVVAHEIGHLAHRGIWTFHRAVSWVLFLLWLALMAYVELCLRTRFRSLEVLRYAWWLALFTVPPLLYYAYSRSRERRAEASAALYSDPRALISCHYKLARLNDIPMDRPTWARALNTHPPLMYALRIVAAKHRISEAEMQEIFRRAESGLNDPKSERYEPVYYKDAGSGPVDRKPYRPPALAGVILAGGMWLCIWTFVGVVTFGGGLGLSFLFGVGVVGAGLLAILWMVLRDRRARKLRVDLKEELTQKYGVERMASMLLVDTMFFEDSDRHAWQAALIGVQGGRLEALGETRELSVAIEGVREVTESQEQTSWSLSQQVPMIIYELGGVRQWIALRVLGRPGKRLPKEQRHPARYLKNLLVSAGARLRSPERPTGRWILRCAMRLAMAAIGLGTAFYCLYVIGRLTGLRRSVGDIPFYIVAGAVASRVLTWVFERKKIEPGDQKQPQ